MYDIKLNDTVCHRKTHADQHHPDRFDSILIQISYRLIMQMEFKWYHRRGLCVELIVMSSLWMQSRARALARSLDFRRTPASKIDFQLCELLMNVSKPFLPSRFYLFRVMNDVNLKGRNKVTHSCLSICKDLPVRYASHRDWPTGPVQ